MFRMMWKRSSTCRTAGICSAHLEIRLPHIAADEADALPHLGGERREESPQSLFRPLLGHPEQPLHSVDLVDEREIGLAVAPLDLIDADGLYAREVPMGKAPFDRVFYGAKHVVPGRVECVGGLLPGEPLGPAGQEPAVACREMFLAVTPRHPLDGHSALRAIDPPHRVDEEHRDVPQRHELKPSWRKPVVPRPLLAASRADRPAVGPGLDLDLEFRI
jgi:hypothetical protein